jgi:hypothetical protein
MGSENIGFSANPIVSKAYYKLLHAAIERAETVSGELSQLDVACLDYAMSLPENVKKMIAIKAKE